MDERARSTSALAAGTITGWHSRNTEAHGITLMRLTDLRPEAMSDAQRRVMDAAISGKRGEVPAPLLAWLHSPEMGDRAQRLGEFCRYETSLGPYLSELAILVTARAWTSHYEW